MIILIPIIVPMLIMIIKQKEVKTHKALLY
jgi:hypothetical protein